MPKTQRRKPCNSIAAQVRAKADINKYPPLPDGCKLTTEESVTIWRQLTASRAADEWRELDLLCIYDCVKLRIKMNAIEKKIDTEEVVLVGPNGYGSVNPLFKARDMLYKQYLTTLRAIGLGVTNREAIALNRTGKKATAVAEKKAIDNSGGKVKSLLA